MTKLQTINQSDHELALELTCADNKINKPFTGNSTRAAKASVAKTEAEKDKESETTLTSGLQLAELQCANVQPVTSSIETAMNL